MRKKVNLVFYFYYAIVPVCGIFLDLIMQVLDPRKTLNNWKATTIIDFSWATQTLYFSVWGSIMLSVWGVCQIIHHYNNKMPNWITSKNLLTLLVSYFTIICIIYLGTELFFPTLIDGMDKWYNITKSIFEHYLTPVSLLVFYFVFTKWEEISSKKFSSRIAWKSDIIMIIYIVFITARRILLQKVAVPYRGIPPMFPYKLADPYYSLKLYFCGFLFLIVSPPAFSIFFNFISNVSRKINLDYRENYIKAKQ